MNLPCFNPCVQCEPSPAGIGTNPIFPDPNATGNPFVNYSFESPDVDVFVGVYWPPLQQPPLGRSWISTFCDGGVCVSTISQEDADLCAQRNSVECDAVNWPVEVPNPNKDDPVPPGFPPRPPTIPAPMIVFKSTAQNCTFQCFEGPAFGFAVPAGAFNGFTQAEADKLAHDYACLQAKNNALCLSSMGGRFGCIGGFVIATVNISGTHTGVVATVIAGILPPGLEMSTTNSTVTITGEPTFVGNYTFTIRVTDDKGNTNTGEYTIVIASITTTSPLPNGLEEDDYVTPLQTSPNMVGPFFWFISSGALPPGLAIDAETGQISGTPTTAGTYNFEVTVVDSQN